MGDSADPAVVVVGAGPSGLFAAIELARHGVRARVVERAPRPHRQARATALQPATLEILYQAGALDRTLAESVHVRYARLFDAALCCVSETALAHAGCPWEFECHLPQWRTEQILADRLADLGVTVQRGVSAVSFRERDDSIDIRLENADGDAELVTAAWVIGAGGASSVTRDSMREELEGDTYPGTALVADVRVSGPLPRDSANLIASPSGYVLLAPLPDDRWITFVGDLSGDEAEPPAPERWQGAVAAAIGHRIDPGLLRVDDVAWAADFRMHRRLAPRLAGGRRFLLGDAGHLSSPFGGEGLNSGLHDAHNLGWKLALRQRGRARPSLLDSYATERHAADWHVLEVSDRLHQVPYSSVSSARTGRFPAAPPPDAVAAAVRARSMLDVCYAGSPLTGEYLEPGEWPPPHPAPGERYPGRTSLPGTRHTILTYGAVPEPDIERLRRRWDGIVDIAAAGDPWTTGLPDRGAILVRPDGYIGFRAAPAGPAGLSALDAHLASYLVPAAG